MWIELHQSLPGHRKLLRLQSLLGIKKSEALGRLCLLWLWAMDSAPDGDLSGVSDRELAGVCGVAPRKAGEFVGALCEAGFLDREGECLRIHDWEDYAGRLLDIREKNRVRAKKSREVRARTVRAPCAQRAVLPDQTIPNQTIPDQTGPDQTPFAPPSLPEGDEEAAGTELFSDCLQQAREQGTDLLWATTRYRELLVRREDQTQEDDHGSA